MRQEIFQDGIQGLEMCFGWQLPEGAVKMWWERVQEHGLADDDFKTGCNKAIDDCKRFPALSELLDFCRAARAARIQQEHEKARRNEDRFRDVDQKALMSRGLRGSPVVQGMIKNAMDLLDEKIDIATWIPTQRMLIGEIKDAAPESIDLMCAALWRLEKKLLPQ